MQRLGCQFSGDKTVCSGTFYCPRCGTLKVDDQVIVPALVERVKQFRLQCGGRHGMAPFDAQLWHKLGIGESIEVPELRKVF